MGTATELDFAACYRAIVARDARFDGRFYTAVTTTRIYCRPICPARTPAASNVRFYRHAAAAEAAGFRPCKRCRPEITPGDPGWNHRADLVGRALRLIDDGLADDGVAALAGRLHISERHLHRLFVAELGVTPTAVIRTRRLLLAKQLLTETSLPVTDVAFAAGFGSVRQFNATMKDAYGFTPSELRATAGPRPPSPPAAGTSPHPDGGPITGPAPAGNGTPTANPVTLTLRLHYRPPFDADSLLGFLAARAIPGLETVDADGYRRTIGDGWVRLTPADGHIRLTAAIGDPRHLARIVARSRRLMDLDADPTAIADALSATALAPLVAKRPGLRVPGAWDGFELAVRAIVGQQVSVAGARTLLARIVERAGTPSFPTAERLAGTDLTGLGLTASRVATLKALAERVTAGEIDLDGAMDPADTVSRLRAIPGIGPWTTGYIAMRALRDPDAWPTGDLGLRRAMTRHAIPEDHIDRWRPWRAYAAQHLWSAQ